MNTVTFGNKNSYADFGLILDHKEIGKPEPRTNYIDVPARDGHLDLTEAFGEVKYKERKNIYYFSYIGSDANWAKTLSALHNYLNGQKHNIYDEANYYWVGRCFVGDAQTKKGIREFTIECDCEPYKYKIEETIVETKRPNLFDKTNYRNTGIYDDLSFDISKLEVGKTYTISFNKPIVQWLKIAPTSYGIVGVEQYDKNGIYSYTFVMNKNTEGKHYLFFGYADYSLIALEDLEKLNIQIEEGTLATAYEPYDTDIVNIINDRKTVTPYVEVLDGAPILSWEDKKTGIKYNGVAIQSNGKYLDLKLYEGNNTITIKGGDMRLTYREASL